MKRSTALFDELVRVLPSLADGYYAHQLFTLLQAEAHEEGYKAGAIDGELHGIGLATTKAEEQSYAAGKRDGLDAAAQRMEGPCRWQGESPYHGDHPCDACKRGMRIRALVDKGPKT